MKIQDLETKIAARADAVVQQKIKTFKAEIDAALKKLFGNASSGIDRFGMYEYVATSSSPNQIVQNKLAALRMAIIDHVRHKDNTQTGHPWPASLWETEREVIRTELLAKMDLMQQLLSSPPRSTDDDVPAEGGSNVV